MNPAPLRFGSIHIIKSGPLAEELKAQNQKRITLDSRQYDDSRIIPSSPTDRFVQRLRTVTGDETISPETYGSVHKTFAWSVRTNGDFVIITNKGPAGRSDISDYDAQKNTYWENYPGKNGFANWVDARKAGGSELNIIEA